MPIDLQMIHEGGGRFRCSTKLDHGLATETFEAGQAVTAKLSRQRSGRQNRWFHSLCYTAWENQTCGDKFDTADRLRKWLLIRAGHCDVKRFPPQAMTREVAQWLRAARDDIDFATDGDCIYARTARSISYKSCDHDTMCAVADRVIDVICEQIVPGTTRADWEPYIHGRDSKRVGKRSRKAVRSAEQQRAEIEA